MNLIDLLVKILPVIFELMDNCNRMAAEGGTTVYTGGLAMSHNEMKERIRNPDGAALILLVGELAEQRGLNVWQRVRQRGQLRNEVRQMAANMTDEECNWLCDTYCRANGYPCEHDH